MNDVDYISFVRLDATCTLASAEVLMRGGEGGGLPFAFQVGFLSLGGCFMSRSLCENSVARRKMSSIGTHCSWSYVVFGGGHVS